MKIVNNLIASITVSHSYFQNGECRNLQCIPIDETRELFRKYNFRVEKFRNRFNIFSGSSSNLTGYFNYLSSIGVQPYFSFELNSSDPEFYYYTDIPVDFKGVIAFDTGSSQNVKDDSSITLVPDFDRTVSGKGLAKITIHFDDLVQQLNKNASVSYKINFATRKTQWVYYVINKNNISLDNPSIQGKNEIAFTGPESIVAPTGAPAIKFTSGNNLLPYSDTSQLKFDLVDQVTKPLAGNNLATKIISIFKGLPGPDPAKMNRSVSEGKTTLISPIYIYL